MDELNPIIFTVTYALGRNYFSFDDKNKIIINVNLRQNDIHKSPTLLNKVMLKKLKELDNTASLPAFSSDTLVIPYQLEIFNKIEEFIHACQKIPMASVYNDITKQLKILIPEYDTSKKTYYTRGLINTTKEELYNGIEYNVELILDASAEV